MLQPQSYRNLKPQHQHWVSLYIRNGCDPIKTSQQMFSADSPEQIKRRSRTMMQNQNIQQAISDKLLRQEEKYNTSRQAMTERLFSLIDKVALLPEGEQKLSHLKFILSVYNELNKIAGHHQTTVNTNEQRSITVQLVGIDDAETINNRIEDATIIVEPIKIEPSSLVDPIPFSLDDLDEISDELPEDLMDDPAKDSSQD